MQKASDLIKHLQNLIDKYGDYPVVGLGNDSDDGMYNIDEFDFSLKELVQDEEGNYRYEHCFKKEEKKKVFLINI